MEIKNHEMIEMVVVKGYICDKCGKKHYHEDILETQEFLHIKFTGGYGSIFGDMMLVECDICQHCLYEMIKDFCRMTQY
jgi:hypothetical protein